MSQREGGNDAHHRPYASRSGEQRDEEGCLSIPGFRGHVARPQYVTIRALDGTGKEHDRPVLVIRPFNAETFFGVALIGHPRVGRYYFPLGRVDDREAVANLSQARLFDTKRFIRKIGTVNEHTFRELAMALALTLFPFLPLK